MKTTVHLLDTEYKARALTRLLACIVPFFPGKLGLEQIQNLVLQMHRHRYLLQGFNGTMNFENTSGNTPGCKTDAKIAKADPIKLS